MPASRRFARILVIAAGILACGIGLTVQAGWLLERAALIHIRSDYPAMTFNTAAGFVLLGVGLFLMALGRLRLAATAAGVAAVLGGLTLLEYLSGVNLGID